MASQRPRNRRLEQVTDIHEVRRSPRLVGRLTTYREDHRAQLVSSRPSIKSYGRSKRSSQSREVSILNESGQSVPATFDEDGSDRRPGVPPHLFGLDDSDAESTNSSAAEQHRTYQSLETNRVLHVTPITQIENCSEDAAGVISMAWSFVKSCLYKLGSLVYLAATGLLCLDVIILNRFFNYGKPSSSARYLFLPLVLMAVIFFLIGGKWMGHNTGVNVDNVDMTAVLRTVANQVENELNDFKKSFRAETDTSIEMSIHDSEKKTWLTISEELTQRDTVIADQSRLANDVTERFSGRMTAFEDRLNSIQDTIASLSLRISEIPPALHDAKISDEAIAQLRSSFLTDLENLSKELKNLVGDTEINLSNKVIVISEKADLLNNALLDAQASIRDSLATASSMMKRLDDHDIQITNLKSKEDELLLLLTQFKESTLRKIESLEISFGNKISADQAITLFHEELDKVLADPNGALRVWISEVSASPEMFKDLEAKLNQRLKVSPVGGLSKQDVEEIIAVSLEKYSADRIGKFDFALENSGGNVITDKCSPTFTQSLSTVTFFGYPLWQSCGTPKTIIKPEVYPGDCWAMNGTSGYATIQLVGNIIITEVTVEHIATQLTPNNSVDSAPKDISVYGMSSIEDEKGTLLGKFSYDIEKPAIQQFSLQASSVAYEIVRFKFKNNYGNPAFTCIYRVRVHGHYPN